MSNCSPLEEVGRQMASVVDAFNRGRDLSKRVTLLADVSSEPIDWIWPRRIARGKLHVLAGDPGLGKSLLTLDVASRITSGREWPDGGSAPIGNVLVFSLEDDAGDTIRPRVIAMGGDEYRVYVETREGTPLSLEKDMGDLEGLISGTGAVFVIIDPLNAYLGRQVDPFNDAKVRQVLSPLSRAASKMKAAILAVMHLNKDEKKDDLYRVGGSIGFVGAARLVFAVTGDPKNPEVDRLFAPLKTNISKLAVPLGYRVVEVSSGHPVLEWTGERDTSTGRVLNAVAQTNRPDEALARAEEFLSEILAEGSQLSKEVEVQAKRRGISITTLDRARKSLGVKAERNWSLANGPWMMSLPKDRLGKPSIESTPEAEGGSEPIPLQGSK
jgi:putative DNA primase/helicase